MQHNLIWIEIYQWKFKKTSNQTEC